MQKISFAQGFDGEVQFYVFSTSGLPLENVHIHYDESEAVTDESGFAAFLYPAGSHEFLLTLDGKPVTNVSVNIRQGQAVELIITVDTDSLKIARTESDEKEEITRLKEGRAELNQSLPKGVFSGRVLHIENQENVAGATVLFRGVNLETVTDEKGRFFVELPEGTYSVSVIHPDYTTRTVNDIEIKEEEETAVVISLTPSAITLEAVRNFATTEVRVQGGVTTLIEETKNSGVVLNLIGSEQISRTGDSDAASALKRVTGLSVIDGKYVYVRGMGERYSSSYLNGARLPSPEIDKRVVPLDLFPTTVIEAMAIQKAYSPDLYGDFGGGAVSLRTTGIPNDRYKRRLKTVISTSVSYNEDVTFTERLMEESSPLDFLGIDTGDRAVPGIIPDDKVNPGDIATPGLGQDLVNEIGRSMPGKWAGEERLLLPDYGLTFSIRDKIDFENERAFGWSFSSLYKNSSNFRQWKNTRYSSVENEQVRYSYDVETGTYNVDLGGLLDLEYHFNRDYTLESTTLLVRTTKSEFQNNVGYYDASLYDQKEASWVEQMLLSQRLGGLIGLPFLNSSSINWNYTLSIADRYEPNHSNATYSKQDDAGEDEPYEIQTDANSNTKYWANVEDWIHDAQFDLEIPFFLLNETADYINLGFQFMHQTRDSEIRRFDFNVQPGEVSDYNGSLPIDEIINPGTIGNLIEFKEITNSTDSYIGTHQIIGGYINSDILMLNAIRLNVGMRIEYSNQNVVTYNLFNITEEIASSLVTADLLPSVNLTIPLWEKMQLRLGGAMTVNRPDLQELSASVKYGVAGSLNTKGNPDLQRARLYNGDLRWEYYITEQENISMGGFYKYFENAIEVVTYPGEGGYTTQRNVPVAYNIGAELEWMLSLRYISDGIRELVRKTRPAPNVRRVMGSVGGVFRDMTTSGNISIIHSQIDYQGEQGVNTSSKRPLQGQSPYIINATLGYKNKVSWSVDRKTHTSLFLSYNVFGPRIQSIGTRQGNVAGYDGEPDIYEDPFHQLDFVAKHSFNEVFSVGLKVKNILNRPVQITQGDLVLDEYRKGRSYSLSAKIEL